MSAEADTLNNHTVVRTRQIINHKKKLVAAPRMGSHFTTAHQIDTPEPSISFGNLQAPISLRFPLHSVDPSAQLNPRKSYDFLRETPFGRSWSIGYSSIDCAMLRALLRPRHVCLRATETRTLSKSWIWMCPWPTNALAETEESMIPSVSTICLRESQK